MPPKAAPLAADVPSAKTLVAHHGFDCLPLLLDFSTAMRAGMPLGITRAVCKVFPRTDHFRLPIGPQTCGE
jgi:hypothetical protein